MSLEAVMQVLERALIDKAFREHLAADFEAAVKDYDLTAEEISRLRNADADALRAASVEGRLL